MSVCIASFAGVPDSVAEARRFVAGALRIAPETDVPDDVCGTAELIVSELATNALVHTTSGEPDQHFEVHVRIDERGLRTEVRTKRPRLLYAVPHVIDAHPWEEGGRGLFLVDQLAGDWGTLTPYAEGVYFTLRWLKSHNVVPLKTL